MQISYWVNIGKCNNYLSFCITTIQLSEKATCLKPWFIIHLYCQFFLSFLPFLIFSFTSLLYLPHFVFYLSSLSYFTPFLVAISWTILSSFSTFFLYFPYFLLKSSLVSILSILQLHSGVWEKILSTNNLFILYLIISLQELNVMIQKVK